MSPRARVQDSVSVCSWRGCKRPTRDHALVCDGCLDELAIGLRDLLPTESDRPTDMVAIRTVVTIAAGPLPVPADGLERTPGDREALPPTQVEWCVYPRPREVVPGLWDELQATIVGERAIDYGSGSGGGSGERGVVSVGLVLPEAASDVAEVLRLWLRHLVRLAVEFRLDHNAPPEWVSRFPQASVPGMAEWLSWRVDAMCWNPEVADAAGSLHRLIDQASWVVNRPEARQQLGDCPAQGCDGHLSALPAATFASCHRDRAHQVEAQPLRDRLLDELDDRICTAAQIAHLTTYLGLRKNREQVRKQINQWAHRARIATRGLDADGDPTYRFGEVKTLLLEAEARSTKPETHLHNSKGA